MEQGPNRFLSRRQLLGGALGTGLTAIGARMTEGLQRTDMQGEQRDREPTDRVEFSEPHRSGCPWETKIPPLSPEQQERDQQEMQRFQSELAQFRRRFQDNLPEAEGGIIDSLETQATTRAFLLNSPLPSRLNDIASVFVRYPAHRGNQARSLFEHTLQVFNECQCQGLIYAAIQRAAEIVGGQAHFERDAWYYGSRIRDYVPREKDMWSQDIDPRNKPGIPEADRRRMKADPAWSGQRRKTLFRTLAQKPSLIERAQREDLTVVEFFSLIKAIVHERTRLSEEEKRHESLEQTAEKLLSDRRAELRRALLSPETETAIVFYGDDRRLMHGAADTHWDGPLEAAGVRPERIQKIGTSDTRNNRQALDDLKRAIGSSHGKTFLSFKTHGATNSLYIDNQRGTESISDRCIAEALLARIQTTRNPSTLKDMSIIVDACHSYEFRNNVIRCLEELWRTSPMRAYPFDRVAKPFFVTVVQEGSVGQGGSLICGGADAQFSGIQKDRALYVQRLLQNIQPRIYEENDMTFFGSGTGREFAERRSSRTEASARA